MGSFRDSRNILPSDKCIPGRRQGREEREMEMMRGAVEGRERKNEAERGNEKQGEDGRDLGYLSLCGRKLGQGMLGYWEGWNLGYLG